MVAAQVSTEAAAVSARIINPNEGEIELNRNASLNPFFFLVSGVFEDRSRAVYPSGACFLVQREELALSLPPKEMMLYYEDVFVGMALRVRGGEIIQADDAVVHHEHGYSVAKVNARRLTFLRERNRLTCMLAFFSCWTLFKMWFIGPPVAIARLIAAPRGTKSWLGAFTAWVHAAFSIWFVRRARRSVTGRVKQGEDICREYFTSRLVPDDHPSAKRTNRIARFILRLMGIRTMD
jgi:GT2 family glycosyltransferase